MLECFNYFKKTFAAVQPTKLFRFSSWIPTLCNPEIPFNLDPPTYQQVTSVIRKMKASGSPCPLDQLSIICFKRCPFLRTHLGGAVAPPPPQLSEKPFFQNVGIRVENCWGDYLTVKEDQFTKKEEKTPDLIYIF